MTNYPVSFLRGLSTDACLSDGIITAAAFQIHFEPQFMKNDCSAQSIGWEDDSLVVNLMLSQKKEERIQFKLGLARIPTESMNQILKSPAFRGVVSYDREPLEGNPYHGNLLISKKSTKTQRKLLPAVIAAQFSDIIPPGT